MTGRFLLILAGVAALSGCGDMLASLCEGRVNSAMLKASRANYTNGQKAGAKAAMDCIYAQGGRAEQAVEVCRKKMRL